MIVFRKDTNSGRHPDADNGYKKTVLLAIRTIAHYGTLDVAKSDFSID